MILRRACLRDINERCPVAGRLAAFPWLQLHGPDMVPSEPKHDPNETEAISLEDLARAFAQALGEDAPESAPPAEPDLGDEQALEPIADGNQGGSDEQPILAGSNVCDDEESRYVNPAGVLEALLFVGDPDGKPHNPTYAAELMRGVTPSEVARLAAELNERYRRRGCPYRVVFEGGGYRMRLLEEYADLRNAFFGPVRPIKLSRQAVEVLAVVAYRQPVTVQDVNNLRGKPSGAILAQLVRRDLLAVSHEAAERNARKAARYRTTKRFLELFGLENLEDLPQVGGPLPPLDTE
ncbi:hypothetical protein JCM17478_26820 [Thermopirellula anaerolimosa]